MNHFRITIIALLCMASFGCVEGETTFTVNPDGSAKMQIDVVSGMPLNFDGAPTAKKGGEETLDDLIRKSIRPTLELPGVAAWKDVAAEFLPNGKLKFSGTAYVKRLEDFNSNGGSIPFFSPTCSATRDPAGALVLVGKKKDGDISPQKRIPKTPDEIRKMTDEELNKHILRDLIELQSSKPLLQAFLADAKVKTTYILPGEVTVATGFVKDGRKATLVLDGNKILANLNKFLTQDRAALHKLYQSAPGPLPDSFLFELGNPDQGSLTVAKPGEALFDFDKEIAEARAAYPQLRKKFGFGDDLRLPTGKTPPKK